MSRILPIAALSFLLMVSTAKAADFGDLNCDEDIDVVDVVLSINTALGLALNAELDPNGNNIPDACEPYISEVTCGANTILNGAGDGCEIAPGVLAAAAAEGFENGVASVDGASFCGEGTQFEDGACVSTTPAIPEVTCGAGTILADLTCVIDGTQVLCPQDCNDIWGGNAVTDNCGACDADPSNDCVPDCAGEWGGIATMDECNTCDADPTNDCVLGCNNPDAINFDPAATHDDGSCIVCDPMNLQVEATDASCAGGDGSVDISHDCAGGNSLLTPELAKFQESIDMSLFNFEACMWGQAESCEMWVMDGLASVGGIDPFELRDELEALDGAYPMLALFLEASWNAPFAFEACMTGDVNMCAEWSWQMQVGIDTWWLMDELYTLSTLTDDSDCATVITNGDGEEVSSTGLDAGDYLVTLSMPDGCSESVTTTVAGPDNCQQLCDAGDQNICCLLGDVWACVDLCNQADSESCVKACELGNNETCQIACSQGTVEACIPSCDVYQTLDDCTSACDQGDQEACDTLPCLTTGCSSMNAIGNTICDASCNNTECNFDGGDCD